MNYVVLLFPVASEETPYEQKFVLISAKKKKTKLMVTNRMIFLNFLLGEVRIDY